MHLPVYFVFVFCIFLQSELALNVNNGKCKGGNATIRFTYMGHESCFFHYPFLYPNLNRGPHNFFYNAKQINTSSRFSIPLSSVCQTQTTTPEMNT